MGVCLRLDENDELKGEEKLILMLNYDEFLLDLSLLTTFEKANPFFLLCDAFFSLKRNQVTSK